MTQYYRADKDERDFALEYPEYRTKLVSDFATAFKTNLVGDDRSDYGLAWVGRTNVAELTDLLESIGGSFGYNDFYLEDLLHTLYLYGHTTDFYFGREGSPVLYLSISGEVVDEIAKRVKADECDYEGNGVYRLWWD